MSKEGKHVKIKSWEAMEKEYGLKSDGSIACLGLFMKEMEDRISNNRVIKVREFDGLKHYVWNVDTHHVYFITDDMIEAKLKEG